MVSALGPQSVLLKMSKVKALEAEAFEEFVARHRVMAAAITFVPETVGVLNHHFEVAVLNAMRTSDVIHVLGSPREAMSPESNREARRNKEPLDSKVVLC
jgi:hypothetical protein